MLRKLSEQVHNDIKEDELDDVLKPIDPDVHAEKKAAKAAEKKELEQAVRFRINALDVYNSEHVKLLHYLYDELNSAPDVFQFMQDDLLTELNQGTFSIEDLDWILLKTEGVGQ